MTPKEKAEQLVIKMYQPLPASKEAEKGKEHLYYNQFNAAKQCALIAVDEIIKAIDFDWMEVQNLESEHRYWQKVKNEIIGGEKCSKHGVKKEGESCTLNDNCIYPKCLE